MVCLWIISKDTVPQLFLQNPTMRTVVTCHEAILQIMSIPALLLDFMGRMHMINHLYACVVWQEILFGKSLVYVSDQSFLKVCKFLVENFRLDL